MGQEKKRDLRDPKAPPTSVTNTDERFAGAENPTIMPKSEGRMVQPDLGGKVPDGQVTKSN